jgi:hypothetical protein
MEWGIIIPVTIQVILTLGGLIIHYTRSETKNNERYKHLKQTLDNHESRIYGLESDKTRANGQSTYISRPEFDREETERDRLCEERGKNIGYIFERLGNCENRITALESMK